MEDLAHFIQSMSEKYGLLDGIDSKEQPGELNGLASGKQIKERPSSAASNSHANNNEVSSGQQANNWEYLSLFVTGQTVDTKKPSPLAFQSEGDSHLHAYARMIDINKEPEPESPLPATPQVLSGDAGEGFVEIDSVPVGGVETGKVEKGFPKEYVQNVYVLKDSGGKQQMMTNCESLSESCQLREANGRQNSVRSLQLSRRTNELCSPMELDQHCQTGVSSCRSDHLDDLTEPSVFENRHLQQQHGAECSTTTTAGDVNSGRVESEPNYEENQTRRPISTSSISANAGGGQEQSQGRRHRGVVSSFVVLDNEADFGEHVALHEYAISSGGSSSKSYRTEGPDTDQDVQKSQDGRSETPIDEYCSNLHCNELAEEEDERRNRPMSDGHRQAQHSRSRSLDERERGIVSSHDKYYAGEEENPSVDDQTPEGESAGGFEFIGTDVSGGFDLGETGATFGKPVKKEPQRTTIRGCESGIQPKKGNYEHREFHQELTQDLQETETTRASFNERNRDPPGAKQQSLQTFKRTKKEREQKDRGRNWDDLEEESISLSDERRSNQNLLVDRGQEKQPRGASSARVQGLRKDSCHVLEEEERTGKEGRGDSGFRANSFEYRCNNSGNENEEHAGNQEKLESCDHREKRNENGPPEETRNKHREKHFVLDSAESYSQVEDLLSSIHALSNNEMRDRSSLLDKATNKLIAEVEGRKEPSMKAKSSSDSARMVEPMQHRESSRLTKHGLETTRQQQLAGLTSDLTGPCTIDEARIFESWDLDEDFSLHPGRPLWESESVKSKWIYVNNILCDNGFSPLNSSCLNLTAESTDELFDALEDVVRNYSRREKLVQELLAERDSLRQEEERNDQVTVKLETQVESLKQKLAASEQRAELAAAAADKNIAALRKEHQRLEATHASALQRSSQLEHVCRAKERSIRKLQEKIEEAVTREHSQRTREKELYDKLKQKVAISQKAQGEIIESNFLLRDLKPAAIVGIYERQRAASEAEMSHLREENARLCKELRDKENTLLSKAMSAVDADQAELDQREQDLIQQLTEVLEIQQIEKELTKKSTESRPLEHKEDSALLPLAVNQTDSLKKENQNCQMAVKARSAEIDSSMSLLQRLQLDAAQERRTNQLLEEIEKKKLEYSATNVGQASNTNGCSHGRCEEVLQDICSKLKIVDPHRISDAVDSLLKVVTAVPRMETFIDDVCEVVFNEGCMFLVRNDSDYVGQTPEAIPGILRFWLQQLQANEELQHFKESICTQLWERYDDKAEKHPMNCKLAAASVKDLINIERQYLLSQESYRESKSLMKAEPQKLLHRIIAHFQMLFEIPRLEGVMAVMNSVYIQISEYHNFARALCSLLGLPKDSGANTIISTVTGLLNKVSNLY